MGSRSKRWPWRRSSGPEKKLSPYQFHLLQRLLHAYLQEEVGTLDELTRSELTAHTARFADVLGANAQSWQEIVEGFYGAALVELRSARDRGPASANDLAAPQQHRNPGPGHPPSPASHRPAVQGELRQLIDVLGAEDGDDRVQIPWKIFGGPTETSEFDDEGEFTRYYSSPEMGADMVYVHGVFDSAVLAIRPDGGPGSYPLPDALIKGLPLTTATRAEVREFFGDPEAEGADWLRFELDPCFIWVGFEDDHVNGVSVMVDAP